MSHYDEATIFYINVTENLPVTEERSSSIKLDDKNNNF